MTVDQTIKQRLVGAIVLVAVAVIFLPGILGQKNERKIFSSKITDTTAASDLDQPDTNSVKLSLSDEPDQKKPINDSTGAAKKPSNIDEGAKIALQKPATSKPQKTASSPQQKPPNQPKKNSVTNKAEVKKQAINKAVKTNPALVTKPTSKQFKQPSWLIQVGSFSSNANARSLAKKLEERKMKAFVRPVNLKQGEVLYRVFVGPWFEKRQAESKIAQVAEITRLKPIVVRWQANLQ